MKLIVAMLSLRAEWLDLAIRRMEQVFGPADLIGPVTDFSLTHYYDDEMGSPLRRRFVAFERLIAPEAIAEIKRATNALEEEFAAAARRRSAARTGGASGIDAAIFDGLATVPRRPVNLDPGYVAEGKLVLASTKDFAHRIYLGGGIYAEVTLMYGQGRWLPQKYTFPDYASGLYDEFLTAVRQALRRQLELLRSRA